MSFIRRVLFIGCTVCGEGCVVDSMAIFKQSYTTPGTEGFTCICGKKSCPGDVFTLSFLPRS